MSEPSLPDAHTWLISEPEARLLAGFIGRRLERIRFDGVSASLAFDSCVLLAYPEPGVGGSPMRPTEEIMRLFVRVATPEETARLDTSVVKQLDLRQRITDIRVLHSLVVFGEPVAVGPQRLTDSVQLPAGLGYGVECFNPSHVAPKQLEQLAQRGCANLVDVGIVVSLEEGGCAVVRTDGCRWAVFVTAESRGDAHQETAIAVALEDRARPFSPPQSS